MRHHPLKPANPWFAKETVNRLWGHFFGKGLIDPVDDLTGSKDQVLPQLLDLLAQKFAQSGFDLRYLIAALARSRAYALSNSLDSWARWPEAGTRSPCLKAVS